MEKRMIRLPHIVVERYPSEPDWTLSEFFINGVKRGVGVEDEHRKTKVKGETRISKGIYEVDFGYSPRFSKGYFSDANGNISRIKTTRFNREHLVLRVKNVPGFSNILWHWGNTDLDTDGCYCVGAVFGTLNTSKGIRRGVLGSRKKYEEIYPDLFVLVTNNQRKGIKTYVEYRDKFTTN
jgi:hypothetical protein